MCTCLVAMAGVVACVVLALIFGLSPLLFTGILLLALAGIVGWAVGLP